MDVTATRRERVLLELEDKFTREMAAAATATAALNRELGGLNGSTTSATKSTDGLGASTEKTTRKTKEYSIEVALAEEKTARFRKSLRDQAKAMLDVEAGASVAEEAVKGVGDSSDNSGRQIDRLSGRLALLAQAAAVLGPALVPLGAATVPAIVGLTAQLGALAGAVGVGALAFSGLGDGLDALNAFQLEPTAENLAALQQEMEKLGSAGEGFARFLDSVAPRFQTLQMAAREGLFPGLEDGITNLLPLLPQVRDIITQIGEAMGGLASDAGANLAGPRFEAFFTYLENEAAPILTEFGQTAGNFVEGFANLLVGLSPAAADFSGGLLEMSRSFAQWSRSLSTNDGFQHFLDYVREAGPKAVDFLGSLVDAIAALAKAAAPVGDAVLPALTSLLDTFTAIANSPFGPAIIGIAAAVSAFSRAMALAEVATTKFGRAGSALVGLAVAGAAIDGIRDSAAGAAPEVEKLTAALIAANGDQFAAEFGGSVKQALDTLDPGVIDTIAGSLNNLGEKGGTVGTALVNGFGALVGFSQPLNDTAVSSEQVAEAFGSLDSALSGLVSSAGPERAQAAFAALAKDQGLTEAQTSALMDQLPAFSTALQASGNAATLAGESQRRFSNAMGLSAQAAREEAAALRASVDAMREKANAANAAFNAETQYRQALKDAAAQAKRNEAGIDGNTKAALANRSALGNLAGAWNNQSAAVKNNVARFRESRTAFIQTATAMGVPTAAAEKLADRLLEIPKSVVSKIEAKGAPEAIAAAMRVKAAMNSVVDRTVYLTTVTRNVGGRPIGGQAPGSATGADGATVPKTNRPYADHPDHIYMLAPGEEVISNRHGEADRYRAAMGIPPARHLADGGTTGGSRYSPNRPGSYGFDLFTLADAADAATRASDTLADALASTATRGANPFADSLKDSAASLKSETQARAKMLTAEQEANKARLDALRAEADSLRSSVADRLISDPFARSDQQREAYVVPLPDLTGMSPTEAQAATEAYRAEVLRQQAIDDQINASMQRSPADILRADIAQARTLADQVRQLTGKGLKGDALQALLGSGDAAQVAAYAGGSRADARTYQRFFEQRAQVVSAAGQVAVDTSGITAAIREGRADQKETNTELRALNERMERIEKRIEQSPRETGEAVADAVTGKVKDATRTGGRRG